MNPSWLSVLSPVTTWAARFENCTPCCNLSSIFKGECSWILSYPGLPSEVTGKVAFQWCGSAAKPLCGQSWHFSPADVSQQPVIILWPVRATWWEARGCYQCSFQMWARECYQCCFHCWFQCVRAGWAGPALGMRMSTRSRNGWKQKQLKNSHWGRQYKSVVLFTEVCYPEGPKEYVVVPGQWSCWVELTFEASFFQNKLAKNISRCCAIPLHISCSCHSVISLNLIRRRRAARQISYGHRKPWMKGHGVCQMFFRSSGTPGCFIYPSIHSVDFVAAQIHAPLSLIITSLWV